MLAPSKRLTPVAQYTLLYHLQVESLEGLSARDMSGKLPYSYESITLGLTCLADLGLAEKVANGAKSKVIHFADKGLELWKKAQSIIDEVAAAIRRFREFAEECGVNQRWISPVETCLSEHLSVWGLEAKIPM